MRAFLRGGEIALGERGTWGKSKVPWITRGSDAKFLSPEEQELRMACHLLKGRSIDLKCKGELSIPKFTRAHIFSFLEEFPISWEHHQKGHASQNISEGREFIRLHWSGTGDPQQVLSHEISPDGEQLEMWQPRKQGNWPIWEHSLFKQCGWLGKSYSQWVWLNFSPSPHNP